MKWLNRSLLTSHYYALCQSEKDYYKECKKLKIDDPGECFSSGAITHHFHNNGKTNYSIVCIKHNKTKSSVQIAALLIHEAVHIWQRVRDEIGENKPGTESEAYAIQNIAGNLFLAYRPKLFK